MPDLSSAPANDTVSLSFEGELMARFHARQQRCEALEAEITRMAGHINAMDYHFIHLLARFDEDEGWSGDGIKSFAHWLNWKCGMGSMMAREKVRVARALRQLPQIDAAFRSGEISYTKVRAMTRVATPDNEEILMDIARYGTAAHVEKLTRCYRRCKDLHEDELLGELDRRFSYWQDDDGMYVFSGRLPADEGALVAKALDALVELIQRERERQLAEKGARQSAGEKSKATLRMDAQAQAETSARDNANVGTQSSAGERAKANESESARNSASESVQALSEASASRTVADSVVGEAISVNQEAAPPENSGLQPEFVSAETNWHPQEYTSSHASALVQMAEHFLATGSKGANGEARLGTLSGSDRYQLLVHVNVNDASRDCQIEGGPAFRLEDSGFMHPKVVRKLACDASLRLMGEDDDGNIVSIGRKSRIIPRRMALALKQRDCGCRFPGCVQTRNTDFHHILHWADGGETYLDNLVTLCRFHHSRLHRGEFDLEKVNDQLRFLNKDGHEFRRVPFPPFHKPEEVVEQIQAEHRQRGLNITPATAVTSWLGETMDYSMALECLFERDKPDDK